MNGRHFVALLSLPAFLAGALLPHEAGARSEIVPGPVEARVLSVVDGDTLLVEARVWPGHRVRVRVRIRGIDAPELRASCPAERAAAILARDALSGMIGDGMVFVTRIGGGKYYGRVLADVTTAGFGDVADGLLRRGLVRPYEGGRREGWCVPAP